ncbi:CCA tRNA nucleotidyltransferase [Stieleria sp. TO1_6]|uniref:CCA tRNA nucleotidyltransferase n=1 Tax=Stieleria tagensis TaxID=2956795 RepID=UPI00209B8A29|nr:CCA tRNA nucleotidyltransferase [Stieleria tagensis]MCO8123658.1 CCA tRNA nucleotidyltransferase [Stieleria tagensis]
MTVQKTVFDFPSDHSGDTGFALAEALRICGRLRDAGHVAYFAGGCVRDALLGRQPKDFDVATDATPDRVREIFGKRKTLAFGASFGVIGVLPESRPSALVALQPTEVATFRSDGQYSDGRRPDKVHYGDAENDAQRRDFTINGLFYDPASGQVIDYVGGRDDLAIKCLRTIGVAADRFDEDKLRMLRAVRFATSLGFRLETQTRLEIIARADQIQVVSGERIGAEMRRIVVCENASFGLRLLHDCGLGDVVLPEWEGSDQDRLRRYLQHRDGVSLESSLGLVMIVMADAESETSGNADCVAAATRILAEVAKRWRLSNEESRRIRFCLDHWQVIVTADRRKWSTVQPILIDRDISWLMELVSAIVVADDRSSSGIDLCRDALNWPAQRLNPTPLVDGQSLQQAGYRPGPKFRHWIQAIRDAQLDGQISTVDEAFERIEELAGE